MSAGRRRSKRTRACDISPAVREIVNRRDKGCIFCLAAYELPQGYIPELFRMEIMHFVSRSTGGLGIPENLAKLLLSSPDAGPVAQAKRDETDLRELSAESLSGLGGKQAVFCKR